jgi:hypothetical protein
VIRTGFLLQHKNVIDSRIKLGNIENVVAFLPQTDDDLAIDALVGQELHAASLGIG